MGEQLGFGNMLQPLFNWKVGCGQSKGWQTQESSQHCRAGVGLLFRLCSSCIRHPYSKYQGELRKCHHVWKISGWTAGNTFYLQQCLPDCPKLVLTGLFWMKWERLISFQAVKNANVQQQCPKHRLVSTASLYNSGSSFLLVGWFPTGKALISADQRFWN